jgi:hypothetical protein
MHKTIVLVSGGFLAAAALQFPVAAIAQQKGSGDLGLASRFTVNVGSFNLDWARKPGLASRVTKKATDPKSRTRR